MKTIWIINIIFGFLTIIVWGLLIYSMKKKNYVWCNYGNGWIGIEKKRQSKGR